MRALRIGLTGGIGSGKSTVAALLAELGAHVVDTDALAHQLTAPGGAGIAPIAAAFGNGMIDPDGALDRSRMRALVFSDTGARQRLEAILHPLIHDRTAADAARAAPGQVVVFDVPLLAESLARSPRWREQVDRILVVDCSEATQLARVMARNGWSAEAVQTIIAQQASRAARLAIADAVLLNDGISLQELAGQVGELWRDWTAVKQSPAANDGGPEPRADD